jgi:hypothetical protein
MKKMHKNALSNTTIKSINRSKYNKVVFKENTYPDPTLEYEFRVDGWRKKKIGAK